MFSTGPIIDEVIKAVQKAENSTKKTFAIVDVHTIKPLDTAGIVSAAKNKKSVFVVEEHYRIGGLGSAIAEVVSEHLPQTRVIRLGTPDRFIKKTGSQKYLRQLLRLDSEGIYATLTRALS